MLVAQIVLTTLGTNSLLRVGGKDFKTAQFDGTMFSATYTCQVRSFLTSSKRKTDIGL